MPPPPTSAMTIKRINREIADIKKEESGGHLGSISLAPSEDNIFHWKGTIPGPQGSCYEGGIFHLDVHLGADYPFSAPKITFATRIYHMNISDKGSICIDILKHNWSPALSLFKVMLSLSSLLTDPNPQDPLVPSIAMEFMRNRPQHDKTARQWTELYARPKPVAPKLAPSPPPTARGKGKKKAPEPTASSSSGPSSRTGTGPSSSTRAQQARMPTAIDADTITIEDSDEEEGSGARSTGMKRKREAGKSKARGGTNIDLVGEDDAEGSRSKSKRKRNTVGDSSSAGRQIGDVIVIDD